MMRNPIYILAPLLCILFCLSGCQEKKVYRIGVSQCSSDDWRNKCNDEILREMMFHPEASVEIRSGEDSNEKQTSDIRYFIENHFDIIICAPNEADAITPVIKEAYDAGIPVIIFDRNIHGESYTAYIGVDNYGIGAAAARYARSLVGHGGRVIEIYGLPGSTPAIDRHNGFVDQAVAEELHIVATGYGNWNYDDSRQVCDSLLETYEDADLVYAHNDRMAIAASDAARDRGMDVRVIGIDAAPEIGMRAVADSVIDATFLYPTEGYRLIRTALAILKGEPYERHTELSTSSVVDLSNADVLLLQNEMLNEETTKVKALKRQMDEYSSRHAEQTTLLYITIAFACLLFIVFYLLLHAYWQRKKHQKELQEQNTLLEAQRDTERELNEQLREATQSKMTFFTNVSHDLRTPLTLISDPVEQLTQATNLTSQQHTLVRIAHKNVRILRRLIDQILDFRKSETGILSLSLREVHIAGLVREWVETFDVAARKKDITLILNLQIPEDFSLSVDPEKMERVCFNLLSNALKFTPKNGLVTVTCRADDDDWLFSVEDTGRGISREEMAHVFERFYQADIIDPQGSGIGLALVDSFVKLHDGEVSVDSVLGEGTTFTVRVPIRHIQPDEDTSAATLDAPLTPSISTEDVEAELSTPEREIRVIRSEDPLLLVIDDNEDIRHLIALLMGDEYNVITASDGKEGLALASKYVPDLIICDVMMPVMDGLECCQRLKQEITTSHIPILLLTACSLDEQRAKGYDSGADGYLPKPFSSQVLISRCRNLIENRKRIRSTSSERPIISKADSEVSVLDLENEFYAKFLKIVDAQMSNSALSVDELASMMGLGRSQFYRKIKALTNYSPVELLRSLRLQRAHELLLTSDRTISEIAYDVGFSSPAYFTRCYRESYGETPSARRKSVR